MLDCLLRDRDLFAQGSKDTVPPEIFTERTQARTAGWRCGSLGHRELLRVRGLRRRITPYEEIYSLQEFALEVLQRP